MFLGSVILFCTQSSGIIQDSNYTVKLNKGTNYTDCTQHIEAQTEITGRDYSVQKRQKMLNESNLPNNRYRIASKNADI